MKRYLFLSLLLLPAVLFACGEHRSTGTDAETPGETQAPETEAPYIDWEEVPEGMLANSLDCESVYLPCKYNEGAYYDIPAKTDAAKKKITFFLPCRVDRSKLTLAGVRDGEDDAYMTVDCSDGTDMPTVKINGVGYTLAVMQSDSPSLFFNIDEAYGTIADMRKTENKGKECFGDFILSMTDAKAEALGVKNTFVSVENDAERAGTALFRGRGNASWNTEKQTFLIGLEKKADLFGFGKGKKWVIVPCYKDPTMLRYQMALLAANAIGAITPQYMPVDVFMNGAYTGSYLFLEKITVGEGRVEMNDLDDRNEIGEEELVLTSAEYRDPDVFSGKIDLTYYRGVTSPEDITGGYLIEKDTRERATTSGNCWFRTTRGQYFTVHSPEFASKEEMEYISSLFQQFEDSIYEKDGVNRLTGKSYDEYMDMDSFISRYFIDEIFRNTDALASSCFFFKPEDERSEKLFAGPLWDYDNTIDWIGSLPEAELWYLTNVGYLKKHDSGKVTRFEYYQQCFTIESFRDAAVGFFEETVYPALGAMLESGGVYDRVFEENRDSVAMSETVTGRADKDYDGKYEEYRNWLEKRLGYFGDTIWEYYYNYKK
ncbi:MAG: CotH kinase family protein [Lachnospiraceae bacterium]|nr:CotH kinase family protein [Lachnospiraceae bacterium]